MSVKYSRLPTTDPESTSAMDFTSIHSFGSNKDLVPAFEYGEKLKNRYKSMFTYSDGHDPNRKIESVEDIKPSVIYKICTSIVTVFCFILFGLTFPISVWFSLKNIQHYERLVIFRLGRLVAAKGPGTVVILPCLDTVTRVDLRMRAFSIPPQKVLTTDGAMVEVGAEVYYRVKDPILSVSNVQDLNHSTRIISETTLQKHLAKYELADINLNKNNITTALITDINLMTLTWGVEVTRATLSHVNIISEPNSALVQPNSANSALNAITSLFSPQESGPAVPGPQPATITELDESSGKELSPKIMSQVEKDQLVELQRQYPHLKDELAYLMQKRGAGDDGVGAAGPRGGGISINPVDILKKVAPKLSSELVAQFMCVYKFVVTGEGGGTFFLDLKHDEGEADEGEPRYGPADVTVTLTTHDLQDLLSGEISAFSAYMTGHIDVAGDMGMASKLSELVELIK